MEALTEDQVQEAYRLLLKREPESKEVIKKHMQCKDKMELYTLFLESSEYRRQMLNKLSADFQRHTPHSIDVDVSEEIISQLISRTEKYWTKIGAEEPHWSVITGEQYRSHNINPEKIEEFYTSGKHNVQALIHTLKRNGITLPASPTICDGGCGLGRLAESFCEIFKGYIGVDISKNHLMLAQKRAEEKGIQNQTQFFLLQDFLASKIRYDVFFSVIMLQHNSPPIIAWLLRQFLSRVNPNGIAFFQVPCHLYDYSFCAKKYLAQTTQPEMEMHAIPQHQIFKILHENDFKILEVLPSPNIGPIGFSFTFLAQKEKRPKFSIKNLLSLRN